MLHGFTGSPASFAGLNVPSTAAQPILGGHLAEPASPNYWAEVDRLAELSPDATELFGYSLGGRLAFGLLARYPTHYRRAVLISAHPGLRTEAERLARQAHDDRFIRLLREEGLPGFVAAWEAQSLWDSQKDLPEHLRSQKKAERMGHCADGLADSLASVGLGRMPDLRAPLSRSKCAVDLLVGGQDKKFLALASELCTLMPHARICVAKNAGHDLILERPALCSAYLFKGIM
jgi:2-succinyl-6-hydroxy-2,4-cyclohexadiene-1-carboxylate synthase